MSLDLAPQVLPAQSAPTRSKVEEQIKELLGQGLSNSVVASAVGCSPGLITQLLSDEHFSQEVTTLRAASLTAATRRDRSIDSIEDQLIAKMSDILPYITKPMEVVAALGAINKMVRRGNPAQQGHVINQTTVNLNLPTTSLHQYTKNSNGEVVEVAGQSLVSMPAAALLTKLKQSALVEGNVQDTAKYDKIARTLPGAPITVGGQDGGVARATAQTGIRALTEGIPREATGGQEELGDGSQLSVESGRPQV